MIRAVLDRLRELIAVEDAGERIEGSGGAILSPQHRRSREAERLLREQPTELERVRDDER